jgi:hypothetical protein
MKKAVVGIVDSAVEAEAVVRELHEHGFGSKDISVVLPDTHASHTVLYRTMTKTQEGAAMGASAGGTLVGAIGLLAGIGALMIPGIGPLIAAGPLLGVLSGLAAGAAVGGVAGALVGLGLPEHEARVYESRLRRGDVLVAVHGERADERERAARILGSARAHDVSTVRETTAARR